MNRYTEPFEPVFLIRADLGHGPDKHRNLLIRLTETIELVQTTKEQRIQLGSAGGGKRLGNGWGVGAGKHEKNKTDQPHRQTDRERQ